VFQLNLVNRAIILHEGRFLVTEVRDPSRAPFVMLFGGHVQLGETLMASTVRELNEELGLTVVPTKLCYIVENFWQRGRSKVHEIGYYFLGHFATPPEGDLRDALQPAPGKQVHPGLLLPEELAAEHFEPEPLRSLLIADAATGFRDCPKLVVINELPAEVDAASGVYQL
jgi:8-oxo-dGTP pyrophosphatase MutT (NUDIX family)